MDHTDGEGAKPLNRSRAAAALTRWALLVTEGMSMAFPAEIYADELSAEREGERWAVGLSGQGRLPVDQPFSGRWEIGDAWVRMVKVTLPQNAAEPWVGTHWTRHGVPEPEAVVFGSRPDAVAWTVTPPIGGVLIDVHQSPWLTTATYDVRGDEEDSVVQLAKVVS